MLYELWAYLCLTLAPFGCSALALLASSQAYVTHEQNDISSSRSHIHTAPHVKEELGGLPPPTLPPQPLCHSPGFLSRKREAALLG